MADFKVLTIDNYINSASFTVAERTREIPTPDGRTTYVQRFTVLTVDGKEIWLEPGEVRDLVKFIR